MDCRKVFVILFVIFLTVTQLFAGTTGKIAGRVVDAATGEPLPGVNVSVQGTTLGAATDLDGYYTILRVPPGTYSVVASMIGYKEVVQTNVVVSVDLTTTVNFQMEATVVTGETVTVVAERPLVIKDLTSSSIKVASQEIEDIPGVLSVTDAVELMPGVIGEGEEIHVRGGRSGEVVYYIDGIAVNDPLFNSEIIDVNKYTVEEVEVITGGYNAEYGNIQSGVVNIVPRMGGTSFTGRIAYFTDDFGSGFFPADVLNDAEERFGTDRFHVPNEAYFKPRGTGLRANSFNTDRWEFNLGGPEPFTNNILPTLGINSLKGKVTFYLSGTAEMTDGYLPNERQDVKLDHYREVFERTNEVQEPGEAPEVQFEGPPKKVRHPFLKRVLGIADWGGRFLNNLSYSASLNFNIDATHKASITYVGSQFWRDDYRHTYKFIPHHTQQTEGHNYSTVFTWTHTLSPKTFYQVRLGYLKNFRLTYPGMRNGIKLTPFYMNNRISGLEQIDPFQVGPGDGDDEFFDSSYTDENPDLAGFFRTGWNGASTWAKHTTQVYTIKVDVTSQISRHHEVKGGFEWKYNDLHNEQIDFGGNKVPQRRLIPPDAGPFITSGALRDFYDRFPNTGSAYIQDKIEFESLIVNVGLRYDRFDPGAQVFEEGEVFLTADTTKRTPVNTKNYLSPRLGISHPITDRSTLYFFYGRFLQIPSLTNLYRRQNRFRVFQNQLNTFGNPDLEAEETISYEVGFDHQFTDDFKIGVTGFFKDVRNQINVEIFGPEAAPFRKFVNRDFGSDRGFEIEIKKRFSHYWSADINYTLMWATTRSSTFPRGIGALGVQAFPNLREVPADWDQRHTINANINIEIPPGQGFRFLGTTIDRMGLNIFLRYGSGLPFTIDEDADPSATINSARLPYFMTLDLRFRKDFKIYRNLLASFYVDVNNLFNRRNVLFLVPDEQHRCIECTLTDPVTGEVVVKHFAHGNPAGNGTARDMDPEQFGAPRQILLGFGFRF
ncbi:MAG: TonB-dependent receptor [Calditrichaeota bacterium]|nr:MAG: TonB-dependent receptor [Calditrichota bacterium]